MINPIREQIRSMLKVERRAGGFRAAFHVRADLEILPDHFPDGMILPGVCMIQAVLLAAAEAQGFDLKLRMLKNAKMMAPILPGDEIMIEADVSAGLDGDIVVKARLNGADKCRADISLIARPDAGGTPA
ncbi:MAG TPA: hypothetical protein VG326_16955 [Tepidisphaeraceae bacterium]|jgi:3-hydroxymyristoyl/3-hydroxydecanoyl-(acyl carrier protein) dehydratase|nr:hypothetical protein [Tepidisphaeraceae bacterium]